MIDVYLDLEQIYEKVVFITQRSLEKSCLELRGLKFMLFSDLFPCLSFDILSFQSITIMLYWEVSPSPRLLEICVLTQLLHHRKYLILGHFLSRIHPSGSSRLYILTILDNDLLPARLLAITVINCNNLKIPDRFWFSQMWLRFLMRVYIFNHNERENGWIYAFLKLYIMKWKVKSLV